MWCIFCYSIVSQGSRCTECLFCLLTSLKKMFTYERMISCKHLHYHAFWIFCTSLLVLIVNGLMLIQTDDKAEKIILWLFVSCIFSVTRSELCDLKSQTVFKLRLMDLYVVLLCDVWDHIPFYFWIGKTSSPALLFLYLKLSLIEAWYSQFYDTVSDLVLTWGEIITWELIYWSTRSNGFFHLLSVKVIVEGFNIVKDLRF